MMKADCDIWDVSDEFYEAYKADFLHHSNREYRDLWLMYCMGGEL